MPSMEPKHGDMRKLRICWVQHGYEFKWAKELVPFLAERGIDVLFVCQFRRTYDNLCAAGLDCAFVGELPRSMARLSPEEAVALDRNYGPPGARQVLRSAVALRELLCKWKINPDRRIDAIGAFYRFWEEVIDCYKIDFFLLRDTATVTQATAYNAARRRGIPYAVLNPGVAKGTFITTDVGEKYIWSELIERVSKGPDPMTDQVREQTRRSISELTTISSERKAAARLVRRFFPALWSTIRSVRDEILAERRADYFEMARIRGERRMTWRRIIRNRLIQMLFRYDQPVDRDFVYHPLFYAQDVVALTRYPHWAENPVALVREVAASLPLGYLLYVKEHPNVPGEHSLRQLRVLRKIPGVRVVAPSVPSHELQARAGAVVVVEGTAGWEAFLRQRPVVVVGEPFYGRSRLIYDAAKISDLHSCLVTAIRENDKRYRENEAEWLWFVHSVLATVWPGDILLHKSRYASLAFGEKAFAMTAASIAEKAHAATRARTNAATPGSSDVHHLRGGT